MPLAPPNPKTDLPNAPDNGRLWSLDVYRGLVMFLLVGEGAAFYHAVQAWDVPWLRPVVRQFEHVAWRGLVFWDLVQPAFMFIVGVAMALSLHKRRQRGEAWSKTARHIGFRCAVLFLLGTGLHCVYADKLVFELWNVLTQLSFTVLVTFLVFRLPIKTQIAVSLGLLLLSDLLYRLGPSSGVDSVFEPGRNFGAWVDLHLMGQINPGHWVAFNAVPSAAHTLWGALAGRLLLSSCSNARVCGVLTAAGAALLAAGYGLDLADAAPIVKRICTSSFVLASGGWCVLALAVFYYVFDVLGVRRGTLLVVVVGMNPILIYLVTETLAWGWLNPKVGIFVGGVLIALGVKDTVAAVATAAVTWALLWGLCAWLYRRRIFIRI